ncbi:MAG: RNA polymerase subunit sigma-70 [Hyphomicrobiales bacterium]|nr:MAG: RNA polymerase subunit sigma-70 [Hyphomicrobiales bacterium]
MMALMTEERTPDAELARNAAGGDRESFSALVERHYGFIFRLAWRLTGHRADAEDLAQEVCARLGRAIRSYRGGAAFTTWLYAIVVNAARDAGRRAAREAAKADAWGAQALVDGHAAVEAEPEDPAEALWAAVRRLPAKQREAVTLVYGEGMNHADAAELMGCSEATVSWHVHEAKKRLRQIVAAGEV